MLPRADCALRILPKRKSDHLLFLRDGDYRLYLDNYDYKRNGSVAVRLKIMRENDI